VTTVDDPAWTSSSTVLSLSIPSGFEDLRLVGNVALSTTGSAQLRFNQKPDGNNDHEEWLNDGTKNDSVEGIELASVSNGTAGNEFGVDIKLIDIGSAASRGGVSIDVIPVFRVSQNLGVAGLLEDADITSVHIIGDIEGASNLKLLGAPV
jgi:hypothetical protein